MKKILSLILAAAMVLSLASVFTLLTFAEETTVDISANVHSELPVQFDPEIDKIEFEDVVTDDASGINKNSNGDFTYHYLKGKYGESYMTFEFEVEEEGTYDVCIGLMAYPSAGVIRSDELSINNQQKYYIERDYSAVTDPVAEYIDGITAYLRAGKNKMTVYLGFGFDNTTIKSLYMDNFFLCKKGPLPQGFVFDDDSGEQVEVDITGATPDLIKFNSNFKPVVNSYVYVARDYVEDEEKGEVMQLTVTDQGGNPAFAFSYAKYLKLLGLDPEEYDCEKYTAAVLCIKTDDGVFDPTVNFLFYVDGDTIPYDDHRVSGTYEADAGWQYVVLDLEESIWWDGIFTGGLIMASIGADIDTVIRVSELALFEDFDAAESYAGAASGDTSDDTTDVLPDDTTDDTTTAATTDDDTSAADTSAAAVDTTVADVTTAESGKSGCGGTIASFAIIAVISLGAISIKRKH